MILKFSKICFSEKKIWFSDEIKHVLSGMPSSNSKKNLSKRQVDNQSQL